MHKAEFIDYIASAEKCTKAEAERIINSFTKNVTSALGKGNEIALIEFGKFYSTKVAERTGRNPQSGKPLTIPAHTRPNFSAGSLLKAACNNKKEAKPKEKKK